MFPCACVLRSIFRACYDHFRRCVTEERSLTRVTLETGSGRKPVTSWGRKDEEFVADFCLVTKRYLDNLEYKVFKIHFLLGADWRLCCRRLNVDRGNFFHTVYRVQEKLGRVFRELEPYALFPVDEYYYGPPRPGAGRALNPKVIPIRRPVETGLPFPVPAVKAA